MAVSQSRSRLRVTPLASETRENGTPRAQSNFCSDSNFIDSSATAEDRRYCANLTYPNADDHISSSDSRSVAVERLAQRVGSGLSRRASIALVAGIRVPPQISRRSTIHPSRARARARRSQKPTAPAKVDTSSPGLAATFYIYRSSRRKFR